MEQSGKFCPIRVRRGSHGHSALTTPCAIRYIPGDNRSVVTGGYGKPGQLCFAADFPLPMNLLALAPEILGGDSQEQQARPKQQPKQQGREAA